MNYSRTGLHLTEGFETCALVAYRPTPKDVPTIGWGHTRGVKMGDTCTREQADAWLLEDVAQSVIAVGRRVKPALTQNQFDALVDFVFNVGETNFASSTMLRMLNAGDMAGAAEQFKRWDMQGGVHLAGLARRRKAETDLFNTP